MDLSSASLWWVAAGIAVAVELATGTFYLLMIALGLAAAAIAAHLGAGGTACRSSPRHLRAVQPPVCGT